jgi:hypothetical protein
MENWARLTELSFADLLARHVAVLNGERTERQAVSSKAARDAFGVEPGGTSVGAASNPVAYTNLVKHHVAWLAGHPAEYERVMQRAYRHVLQRDPYQVELDYWKRQAVLPFVFLAACIEDWARRNRPGLMATTGVATVSVNSPYLAAVRLSPQVAAEARRAAGLPVDGEPALAIAAGRNVVAPGAAPLVSVGGIHFTAAGR